MKKASRWRTYLLLFCFVGWTGLACLLGLLVIWWPRRLFFPLVFGWSRVLAWIERTVMGLDFQVKGTENLPAGPCIVAAKHQSMWETCKMFDLFHGPAIVLKEEITRIPVLKWYAKATGMIPIDRGGRVKTLSRMMQAARQAAADGRKILIFPQGTRVAPFEKKPYKSGIAGIYKEVNLPIVPLALNSGHFWPKNNALIRPGTITLEFLPPIPQGLPRDEMMQRLATALDEASDRLGRNL